MVVVIKKKDFEPFAYHEENDMLLYHGDSEPEDGCPRCQEELYEVEELVIKQEEAKGREFVDIMLTSRPWEDGDKWEFDYIYRRAKSVGIMV